MRVHLQGCVYERPIKVYIDAESTLAKKRIVHNASFYFLCDFDKWIRTALVLEIFQDGLHRLDSWIFVLIHSVPNTHETLLARLDSYDKLGHIARSTNLLHDSITALRSAKVQRSIAGCNGTKLQEIGSVSVEAT